MESARLVGCGWRGGELLEWEGQARVMVRKVAVRSRVGEIMVRFQRSE